MSAVALLPHAIVVLLAGATLSPASPREDLGSIAVFPVENLSGSGVPADEVRQRLVENLTQEGITVVGSARVEAFMTRHRIRYAAGIDAPTAESLRQEMGVDGVLVASMELSSEAVPPKVALFMRLVSIKAAPTVVWADDVGLAGDDAPGFFELGLVNDYQVLLTRAINRVTGSLVAFLRTGEIRRDVKSASKFRPKSAYREMAIDSGRAYTVAVLPFINLSERRNAGEVVSLLFVRHLSALQQFHVLDVGVIRRQLLDARIIMDGGPSLSDAETLAALIDADFVLGGRVTRYADYEGPGGRTKVEFSTVLVEKKSRRVVWSSESYNDGRDGVHFFERGTFRTAHAMATQMVGLTTGMIAGRER